MLIKWELHMQLRIGVGGGRKAPWITGALRESREMAS